MGKSDVYMKRWLSNKERFADLVNGSLFQGRQVFSGKSLRMDDNEQGIIIRKSDGKEISVQRYRDIMMTAEDQTRRKSIMPCPYAECCMMPLVMRIR